MDDWSTFDFELELNAPCAKGWVANLDVLNDESMDGKTIGREAQVICEGHLERCLVECSQKVTSLPWFLFDIYNNNKTNYKFVEINKT